MGEVTYVGLLFRLISHAVQDISSDLTKERPAFGAAQRHVVTTTLHAEYLPLLIEQKAGWTTQSVRMFWKREKSLVLTEIRRPNRPVRTLVAVPPATMGLMCQQGKKTNMERELAKNLQ